MDEREAMTHARSLAWRGWGRVHPNPLVGAVVLADGLIVGEGWHAEFGDRHAEPVALERAAERARGATLVVTLEPCDHHGKQPPCTEAILEAGVRRVVAGLADPNPVATGGAARLAGLGLEVELGVAREAVAAQNAMFLHGFRNQSRPFVALKLATSLDGRIADSSGHSRWISGEPARDYVHWLRAGFAAIAFPFMVTANEVRVSEQEARAYSLYRVFDFAARPRIYTLPGPLTTSCRLEATQFRARPGRRRD
jgi:diaminohydroxyphosphoribosylaminopyrimidine deaminase/5-amino-6-(5-phosphoribosylamino)uracil reductase